MPKPSRKGISASKRLRQSILRRDRNRSVKSRTRTVLTRAVAAIGGDIDTSESAVREAVSALDRAALKGVIHPNAAARSKSRLLKKYNLAVASSVAAAASLASRPSASAAPAETPAPPTTAPRRRSILSRGAEPKAPAAKPAAKAPAKPAAKAPAKSAAKAPAKSAAKAPAKRATATKAEATEAEKPARSRARKTT